MAQSHPLVTIGIPTYNRVVTYLPHTLASALAQGYKNLEIIVSDNCSTDHTEAFVSSMADPRLRYFRQEHNLGPNGNYNFCLQQASGDYFLLLHDDDLIDPDFVQTCMEAADYRNDAGVIRTGTRIIDANGTVLRESRNRVKGLPVEEFFRGWFSGKTELYMVSTLFHTRRLRAWGGFHSKHHLLEDCFAIAELASKYGRVDVEEIKASFRKHPNELTFAAKVTTWGEDFLHLLDHLSSLVPEEKAAAVRREGMRFFARLTYNRVTAIASAKERYRAYFAVFKLFNYRYLPPSRWGPIHMFNRTRGYVGRRVKQLLSYG